MWATLSLVLAVASTLALFCGLLAYSLKVYSSQLSEGLKEQSKALAMIVEPMFRPPPQNTTQIVDLPQETVPSWRDEADSPDLVDNFGRPLTWETPVISEEESVSPADLWARP